MIRLRAERAPSNGCVPGRERDRERRRATFGRLSIVAAAWLALTPSAAGARVLTAQEDARRESVSELCGDLLSRRGELSRTASDLYCLELFPTAAAGGARGVVELGRVPSPFGVAVTPEGRHLHDLTAWITGLPEPEQIGRAHV